MAVYKLNESKSKKKIREAKYKDFKGYPISPCLAMDALAYVYGISPEEIVLRDYTKDEIENAVEEYRIHKESSNRKSKRVIKERYGKGKHVIWDSEVDMYDEDYMEEVKATQYQDYLDELDEDEEPEDFEDWYEDYAYREAEWEQEYQWEELDYNILPEIEKQLNDGILFLFGYYGSNYSNFRPSGDGGIVWYGIDDFKNFLSDFWRVQITTENGILGVICSDHDGTISGELFTAPDNLDELARAIGYEDDVEFGDDLYADNIDIRYLAKHMELLKPIEDTISGYNKDKFKEYRWDKEGLGESRKYKKIVEDRSPRYFSNIGSINIEDDVDETCTDILNNCDLIATDMNVDEDGVSVCVTEENSGLRFWFDLWVDSNGDIDGDWNQYIFHTNNFDDQLRMCLQDNTYFFNEVMEKAEQYAINNGAFTYNDEYEKYEMMV